MDAQTRDDGMHRYEMRAETCKSEHQHIWMGILYAIKSSLLVRCCTLYRSE